MLYAILIMVIVGMYVKFMVLDPRKRDPKVPAWMIAHDVIQEELCALADEAMELTSDFRKRFELDRQVAVLTRVQNKVCDALKQLE